VPQNLFLRSEELGIDNLVYVEPRDSVWSEAWNVTENLIKEIRNEVTSHGSRFVVITLSNPPQVVPNAKLRQAFMERMGSATSSTRIIALDCLPSTRGLG
jgi:hypothetical protein